MAVRRKGGRRRGVPQPALELEPGASGAAREPALDRILDGLNPQQLAAVTHGAGPLLIVAGAGTGKTQVVTRRVAYLVASKIARPSEILALTFTEKAAAEMEQRVDLLVPYGYTDVWVSTFHAFGDRLLRENALELGLSPDFRVLSRAEQVIFFREHLFEFPLRRYRPLGDPTRYIQAILSLFSRAKDEDSGPEEYLRYAATLRAAGEADPGDDELRDLAAQQTELAETYRLYQDLLAREGLVDFGDLITLGLRLLRERPAVLRRCQERFRHILVDEFQDTNYSQFQLVRLLAESHRNVSVVADDDQAVYKFRGAAISNVLTFTGVYPDARRISLVTNYRSHQAILDPAYRLIRHNDPERLEVREGVDKRLTAAAPLGPAPRHLHYDTLSAEADGVASMIAGRVAAGEWRCRDVAILVRSNDDADPFMRALNVRGIPYRFTGSRGLYNREEIRLVLAFLRALAGPSDSLSLYYLGISDLYRIEAGDLSRCLDLANRRNRTLEYVFRTLGEFPDLVEEVSAESRAAITRLLDDLAGMRARAARESTGRVLYEYLMERTGYIRRLVDRGLPQDEVAVANLARFFEIVAAYAEIAPYDRVHAFVEYVDLLIKAGDDPAVAEADPDADAVSVLTVHKAKGLEFQAVFVVSCVADKFPTRRRGEPIALPDALVKDIVPGGDVHRQEERRLFYVAMTRARRDLYLTSARDYGGARPRKVSPFVLEALDVPRVDEAAITASPLETLLRHAPRAPSSPPLPGILPAEEPLVLSFRQVEDYDICPLKYRYTHILRVPVLPDHRVLYGSAVHEAVREYNRRKARGLPVTLDNLLAAFERRWINEGFLSREHEDRRMDEGREVIRRFLEHQEALGRTPTFVEAPFSFQMGSDRVRGRWDRVDVRGDEVVIVDFKTADVRSEKDARRRARASTQLGIYALAYREVYGAVPSRLELHFLGGPRVVVGAVEPTGRLLDEAAETIARVARGIRAQDFAATPDYYRACRYCVFSAICPYTAAAGEPGA